MTAPDLVDRLAAHKLLGTAPREELAWLAAHGSLRRLSSGETLTAKGAVVEGLFVVLSGCITISIDRGSGPQKIMEWREGQVTGLLPYSRLVSPPGDTIASEPTELLAVHRDLFPEMIQQCHTVTSILVHTMVDRARAFTTADLQNEKMISLGKLSAGLAHELNNPVSAIERSTGMLTGLLADAERATRSLAASRLTESQLAAIEDLRGSCLGSREQGVRSPIQRAEREEAIADWLVAHHLDPATADGLAETPVTLEALDRIAALVDGPALDTALKWAAAECSVRSLTAEIQEAAANISGLVMAVKGFTHMDQASVAEPVNLLHGLDNTIRVLRSKARQKSATVVVEVEPNLPLIRGFVGELNQIWANLLDNALDAIPEGGRVEVHAAREQQHVVVRIADNGSGIPESIRARIYDPFFTTKPMGQGTGLGLDIVRRLVRHNDGEITVESRPGRTEFRVALPIADTAGARS